MTRNISTLAAILSVSVLASVTATGTAQASTIFSNFGTGNSYDVNNGGFAGNVFDGSNQTVASSFIAGVTADLGSLSIALSALSGQAAPVTVSLDQNLGGAPGTVLESFNIPVSTLLVTGNNNPVLTFASLTNTLLTSGSEYWVTVSTTSTVDTIVWNNNSTGDTSATAISTDGGATWFSPSGNTPGAYSLSSTAAVPEPEEFAMLLLGLPLIGWAERRKQYAMPKLASA